MIYCKFIQVIILNINKTGSNKIIHIINQAPLYFRYSNNQTNYYYFLIQIYLTKQSPGFYKDWTQISNTKFTTNGACIFVISILPEKI